MAFSVKSSVKHALLCAAMLAAAACSPRKIPPMTVADLMEDRVTLDGVLLKCNQDLSRSRGDIECINARIAIERLDSQKEPAEEAKRAELFERNRERLRLEQERERQQQDAQVKQPDAYHLPVIPVDPAPPAKDPQSPIVGQALQ